MRQNVVDFPKLNGEHELRWDDSFRLLPADDRAIPDLLCEEAARRYRAGESIQVLSPVRAKTGFSVQALNTRLQNEVNPLTAEKPAWGKFRDGDRVIVTQNNAYYNICNGDVGVLHIRGEKPHRVAALAVRGTLKTWQIDRGQGEYGIGHDDAPPPQLALAYALTVHKSQGSQYDTVLMPVSMATTRMLYRNLLYTAISQAGKEVILVGSREALNPRCSASHTRVSPSSSPGPICCALGAAREAAAWREGNCRAIPLSTLPPRAKTSAACGWRRGTA